MLGDIIISGYVYLANRDSVYQRSCYTLGSGNNFAVSVHPFENRVCAPVCGIYDFCRAAAVQRFILWFNNIDIRFIYLPANIDFVILVPRKLGIFFILVRSIQRSIDVCCVFDVRVDQKQAICLAGIRVQSGTNLTAPEAAVSYFNSTSSSSRNVCLCNFSIDHCPADKSGEVGCYPAAYRGSRSKYAAISPCYGIVGKSIFAIFIEGNIYFTLIFSNSNE